MITEFCEKWFFAKNQPLKPVSKEDARNRHSQGLNYCVVIGGFKSPTNLISLAGEWVSVHFFDTLGRAYLNYDFIKNDGRLFLTFAAFREYEEESTAILRSVTFSFSVDGSVVMSVDDQNEVSEIETKASMEPNWADYPAFGEYGSLCDENRIVTS